MKLLRRIAAFLDPDPGGEVTAVQRVTPAHWPEAAAAFPVETVRESEAVDVKPPPRRHQDPGDSFKPKPAARQDMPRLLVNYYVVEIPAGKPHEVRVRFRDTGWQPWRAISAGEHNLPPATIEYGVRMVEAAEQAKAPTRVSRLPDPDFR